MSHGPSVDLKPGTAAEAVFTAAAGSREPPRVDEQRLTAAVERLAAMNAQDGVSVSDPVYPFIRSPFETPLEWLVRCGPPLYRVATEVRRLDERQDRHGILGAALQRQVLTGEQHREALGERQDSLETRLEGGLGAQSMRLDNVAEALECHSNVLAELRRRIENLEPGTPRRCAPADSSVNAQPMTAGEVVGRQRARVDVMVRDHSLMSNAKGYRNPELPLQARSEEYGQTLVSTLWLVRVMHHLAKIRGLAEFDHEGKHVSDTAVDEWQRLLLALVDLAT